MFSRSGPRARAQAANAGPHHRRRRLRREPGRRGDRRARAVRRPRVRPADAAPAAALIARAPRDRARRRSTSRFPEIEKFDHLPPPRVEGATAFVSIMEGCSKYCTFCVVPYTRGEEVSRPFEDVLTEVADLAEQGVQGSHAARPERQRLPRPDRADGEIADLAHAARIRRRRSRASSASATRRRIRRRFTPAAHRRLRRVAASSSSHLHLPVQSGSDRVLAAMKRGYTVARIQVDRAPPARACGRTSRSRRTSSSAFPARPTPISSRRCSSSRRSASTRSFSFVYSPRPGHAGGGAARRRCRRR